MPYNPLSVIGRSRNVTINLILGVPDEDGECNTISKVMVRVDYIISEEMMRYGITLTILLLLNY